MLPTLPEYIRSFFQGVGIEAVVVNNDGENLITIKTEQFMQRREWIERWFTVIVQDEHSTYLRERPRGTGDTR